MSDFETLLHKLTEANLIRMGIEFKRTFTDEELAEAKAQVAIANAQLQTDLKSGTVCHRGKESEAKNERRTFNERV
jgi:hypothetical protein